jgi:hypothetical protein
VIVSVIGQQARLLQVPVYVHAADREWLKPDHLTG